VPVEIWVTDIGFRFASQCYYDLEYFSNFVVTSLHSRVQSDDFPKLRAPDRLKCVEFAAPTPKTVYQKFTQRASNLTRLTFGYSSLTKDVLSLPGEKCFPRLRSLRIVDRSLESSDIEHPEILFQNVIGFLHMSFTSLESFFLGCVASKTQALRYTLHLFHFVQSHWKTLKCVILRLHISLQEVHEGPQEEVLNPLQWRQAMLGELKEEQSAAIDWEALSSVMIIINKHSICQNGLCTVALLCLYTKCMNLCFQLNLEELEVDYGFEFFCALPEWMKFIGTQKYLQHLNFGVGFPLDFSPLAPNFGDNLSTLVSLQLGSKTYVPELGTPFAIDCSLFKDLKALKMFCLIGENNFGAKRRAKMPELTNTSQLPVNITAVAIENIHIDSGELYTLLTTLKNVDHLSLQSIGVENNLGMKLPVLELLVESHKMKELIIRGINGDDCSLHQYETLLSVGLTVPLKTFYCHLKWNCEEGKYDTIPF